MRPTARTTSRRCGAAGTCCASRLTTRPDSPHDQDGAARPRFRAARADRRRGAHPGVTNFSRATNSLSSRLGQFRTPPAKAGFLLATDSRLVLTLDAETIK